MRIYDEVCLCCVQSMHERSVPRDAGLSQPYEAEGLNYHTPQRYATMNNIGTHTNTWTLQHNHTNNRPMDQYNSLPRSFSTTESLDSQSSKKKGKFGTLGRIFSKKDKTRANGNGNGSNTLPLSAASLPSSPPSVRCEL